MCIAFDLERYSTGTDAAQVEKQRAMAGLVREACDRGALGRTQWLTQEQGDGELALLPPGIDESRMLIVLWREFREGLHQYNRHANASARLRMRVAIHEGLTYVADNGFAGTAINTVCRLRDCHAAKDALSETDGDLILITSDRIYQDNICGHDAVELPASAFVKTTVDLPDKEFQATAYIFSGSGSAPEAPLAAASTSAATTAPAPVAPAPSDGAVAGGTFNIGSNVAMRDAVNGKVTNFYQKASE